MPEPGSTGSDHPDVVKHQPTGIGDDAAEEARRYLELEDMKRRLMGPAAESVSPSAVAEDKNSVEVSINGKGEISFRVKCYAPTISESVILARAAATTMRDFRDELGSK